MRKVLYKFSLWLYYRTVPLKHERLDQFNFIHTYDLLRQGVESAYYKARQGQTWREVNEWRERELVPKMKESLKRGVDCSLTHGIKSKTIFK